MLALILCCLVQPDTDLFTKLDALRDKTIKEIKEDIAKIKNKKGFEDTVAVKQKELSAIVRSNSVRLPDFDFNKGVEVGDVGSIGYYYDEMRVITHNGQRVTVGGGRVICSYKIVSFEGSTAILAMPPFNSGNNIVVTNLTGKLVNEKIIYLNKFIAEYQGKEEGNKKYKIIGNESDFLAWQKSRLAAKR